MNKTVREILRYYCTELYRKIFQRKFFDTKRNIVARLYVIRSNNNQRVQGYVSSFSRDVPRCPNETDTTYTDISGKTMRITSFGLELPCCRVATTRYLASITVSLYTTLQFQALQETFTEIYYIVTLQRGLLSNSCIKHSIIGRG